jgi:2-iminobutanoate/2-iminopropanoate deaminase
MPFEIIHTRPDRASEMPYAPAVEVTGEFGLLFLSGVAALELYHKHPHVVEELRLPDDIVEQTHRVMRGIKEILDHRGLTFRYIVKMTEYVTDMREADAIHRTMAEYFGDWTPPSTIVCVNNLSASGARFELDVTAVLPR